MINRKRRVNKHCLQRGDQATAKSDELFLFGGAFEGRY